MRGDIFEDTTIILVGVNGGLSGQILANSTRYFPKATLINVSSRDMTESKWDELLNDNGIDKSRLKIIWSSGRSKPASAKSDCNADFISLEIFCNQKFLKKRLNTEIFFISSGGTVYGNNSGEVNEDSDLNPGSFYAEMKVRSEFLLRRMATEYGISVRICRMANMYGCIPSSQVNGLIDRAINSSRISTDVLIYRSLVSRKQYGTFHDYAQYVLKLAQNSDFNSYDTFYVENIFSDWDYSIEDILDLVKLRMSYLGYNLKIKNEIELSGIVESVILQNSNPSRRIDHSWLSLQNFLDNIK